MAATEEKGWEIVKGWGDMTPREQDAWLAENVMGWEVDRSDGGCWRVVLLDPGGSVTRRLHIGGESPLRWSPTSSLDDAFEVQGRLGELNLRRPYARDLRAVCREAERDRPLDYEETCFLCANAPAPQRAAAAHTTILTARREGWID